MVAVTPTVHIAVGRLLACAVVSDSPSCVLVTESSRALQPMTALWDLYDPAKAPRRFRARSAQKSILLHNCILHFASCLGQEGGGSPPTPADLK